MTGTVREAPAEATKAEPVGVGDRPGPTLSYLICTTPRTGSYVLSEALASTGIAGAPTEYFSGGFQLYWSQRWGTREYAAYLSHVRSIGTTRNGVFGVKVHSNQFDHFLRQATGRPTVPMVDREAILKRWFPAPRYIWLRREDRLRQAISYAKAVQTKIWWHADEPPAPYDAPLPYALEFDHALIERSMVQLEQWDEAWRCYFEVNELEPLVVSYEELSRDVEGTLRRVIAYLGLELPAGFELPQSKFRRQADAVTEEWLARYRTGPEPNGRVDAPTVSRSQRKSRGAPSADLTAILANRRWWICETPFRHLRASHVFTPELYEWMAADFRERLAAGRFGRTMAGYDASALSITAANAGAFSVFTWPAWRDLLAGVLAPDSTGEVNITLHHHAVGSLSGAPHNDLNPGWFIADRARDGVIVADPAECAYQTGVTPGGAASVERIRSVALIYYLANPEVYYGWGGATGLYARGSDRVERPTVAVPPHNNSFIAFECTPFSFHSFMTNPQVERNCLVMWLHRPKGEVVRRWGEHSIVGW